MPMLQVKKLNIAFGPPQRPQHAVQQLDLSLESGQTLALVGESGSGKSMSALALMGLCPENARVQAACLNYAGQDLTGFAEKNWQRLRGRELAMIFQEPLTALNPVLSVGYQVMEAVRRQDPQLSSKDVQQKAVTLLEQVHIPQARHRLMDYPHQFSGGMRQRVLIAMALAGPPRLLIADEPTTALDVTVQAQIMALLDRLQQQYGMAMLLISHDINLVAQHAQEVAIIQNGLILEQGPTQDIVTEPRHPYTRHLLACHPRLASRGQPLGQPWGQTQQEPAPAFAWRQDQPPPLQQVAPGRYLRCWEV